MIIFKNYKKIIILFLEKDFVYNNKIVVIINIILIFVIFITKKIIFEEFREIFVFGRLSKKKNIDPLIKGRTWWQ